MLIKTGVLAASLALAADAFLVPSTSSWPQSADVRSQSQAKTVRLQCRSCPDLMGPDSEGAMDSTSLILEFSTPGDGTVLAMNGAPFWPPISSMGAPNPKGLQVPDNVRTEDAQSHNVPKEYPVAFQTLSTVVQMRHTSAADGSDAEIHDLDITIFEVAGLPAELDTLSVRLLTDESGHISIVDIVDVPSDKNHAAFRTGEVSHNDHIQIDNCQGMFKFFCEAQKFAEAKLRELHHMRHKKPCPGMRHGGKRPKVPFKGGIPKFLPFFSQSTEKHQPVVDSQGYPTHKQHMKQHLSSTMHRIAHTIHRVMVGFVVPVMIGIAAGMTASLLGMLVGTAVAWLWIKVVRGGKRGNASAGQIVLVHEQEISDDCEKEALMADSVALEVEPLPVYNEPPQYSEKE